MKTLQQITDDELNFLVSTRAKALHLANAIKSGEIIEDDIPAARMDLAVFYEDSGQYGHAAEQYHLAGDEVLAKEQFLAQVDKLTRQHYIEEAAIIYVRIGEIPHAIRTCVTSGKTLENILFILPQDKEEAERVSIVMTVLLEADEKTDADYRVLAECYEKRGEYEQVVECSLKMESPDYDTVIELLKGAEDYERAAEVCLTAYANSSFEPKNRDLYCFSAFELYLIAEKFDEAIAICCNELSTWCDGGNRIHSVYVAQGVEETQAWRKTAEIIEQKASPYSQLADSISSAYKKAGMLQKAGDVMLERRPYEEYGLAYELFIASGMTPGDAARRVLNYKKNLFNWQVGELCIKAEMFEEAVIAFEEQGGDSERRDLRWDNILAPLYEKIGRLSDAANSYENIGETNNAIACRRNCKALL